MVSMSPDDRRPPTIVPAPRAPGLPERPGPEAGRRTPGPLVDASPTWEERLRASGLRVTRPRLTVLAVLADGGHPEVEEIADRVRQRRESVSIQAIYDVLGALTRAGLARRIEPAGSLARYEARARDNHHHIVCRGCGEIADVDCAVGSAPCLDPSTTGGYEIDEAEVTFWGLCPACQALRRGD